MNREIKTIFALDGEQKYQDAIKAINDKQKLLTAELKKTTAEFEVNGDKQGALKAKIESLNQQIDLQRQKVAESKNAMEQAAAKYDANSEKMQELTKDYYYAEAGLAKLQKELISSNKDLALQESKLKAAGEAAEKAGKKMQTVGDGMSKAGTAMTFGITAPILAAGKGLLDLGNKFDDAVDTIRIGTGATGDALAGLENDFDTVIQNVPADMDAAASAIADLNTRLGLTGEPLQALSQQFLELSIITGEDVTTSIEQSTQAFSAWKIPTDKMSDSLNTIFKVSQATGIKVNDLTKKVTESAPALQELGFTFEESAAMIGKFEKSGVNTDTVLAALKKSVASFAKEGKSASKGLAEMSAKIKGAKTETEAAAIAMKVFGAKAGPELATQIRAGKLDIADFTAEIANNTETINTAAADTYDYAEQWKMLTNRLAKDLKPVAEQVFGALNKATPTIEKMAKFVGDLAEKFGDLTPRQQETVLKMIAVAAATGPVLTVTGKLTSVIGGATNGIGAFIKKLTEKKAAEAAASAVTGGLGTATTGMAATLGPAAIAIGAVALAAGGLYLAYQESTRSAREAGEAGEEFAAGIASWHDDVDAATSALEGFNMATVVSADKMSEWDAGISDAQGKIIGLAETAAAESRAYTEKEQEEITNLIGLINDYTQKKIDAYQQQAEVVAAMASQETDVTLTKANELIKGAEDAKSQTLAIAEAKYKELIGLAETEYGHLGEKDKAAYDKQVDDAEASYQAQIDAANKTHGETLGIIQQKYADYNKEDMGYIRSMASINDEIAGLEEEKNKRTAEEIAKREEKLNGASLSYIERCKVELENENWYTGEKNKLLDELGTAYENAGQANLDNWIGMVLNTELYGGQVDDKTKEMITNLIASFDLLPDKYKESAKQSLQGYMDGMKEMEPSLFQRVGEVGSGIIKKFKNTFQIKSPSKVFRGMGQNNIDAMATGMEDERPNAEKTAADVSQGIIDAASGSSDIQAYIHAQVTGSGLSAQLGSSGSAGYAAAEKAARSDRRLAVDVSGTVIHKGINDAGELVGVAESTLDQVEDRLRWEATLAGTY